MINRITSSISIRIYKLKKTMSREMVAMKYCSLDKHKTHELQQIVCLLMNFSRQKHLSLTVKNTNKYTTYLVKKRLFRYEILSSIVWRHIQDYASFGGKRFHKELNFFTISPSDKHYVTILFYFFLH